MPNVVFEAGWGEMRWERLGELAADWRTHTIDTTHMTRAEVADAVLLAVFAPLAARLYRTRTDD